MTITRIDRHQKSPGPAGRVATAGAGGSTGAAKGSGSPGAGGVGSGTTNSEAASVGAAAGDGVVSSRGSDCTDASHGRFAAAAEIGVIDAGSKFRHEAPAARALAPGGRHDRDLESLIGSSRDGGRGGDEQHREIVAIPIEQIGGRAGRGDRNVRRQGVADVLLLPRPFQRRVHGAADGKELLPLVVERLIAPGASV